MPSQLDSLSTETLHQVHGGFLSRGASDQMITNYPNVMTPRQAEKLFPRPNQERLRLYYSDMHKFMETSGSTPDGQH